MKHAKRRAAQENKTGREINRRGSAKNKRICAEMAETGQGAVSLAALRRCQHAARNTHKKAAGGRKEARRARDSAGSVEAFGNHRQPRSHRRGNARRRQKRHSPKQTARESSQSMNLLSQPHAVHSPPRKSLARVTLRHAPHARQARDKIKQGEEGLSEWFVFLH